MRQRWTWTAGMVLGLGLLVLAGPAAAVITRLIPLREVLGSEQLIFVTEVEKIDPDRPAMVLRVQEDLKGKPSFRRLPVNLTGDSEGQKEKHTPQLLKRLAPKQALVVFASQRGQRYTAFAYTNGTWFQMIGRAGDDPATVTWSFTHCEPYLRRTFKGSTADLRQVILDGLAGRRPPPEPDVKEPPGLGPEIQPEEKGRQLGREASSGPSGPLFAVIPTFVLMGPLALLAALFPAVFGGLALMFKRWLVLLTIASLDSTLYLLHGWFRGSLKDTWLASPAALWTVLALVTLAGAVWSWRRYRTAAHSGQAEAFRPRAAEGLLLGLLSLIGLATVVYCLTRGTLLTPPWRELLLVWAVAWTGSLCALRVRFTDQRATGDSVVPTEGIMLGALAAACLGLGAASRPAPTVVGGVAVAWMFEAGDAGTIASSPLVAGERVYVGAAHAAGFAQAGAVYCLDRATGKQVWRFDDEGGMKQVFSSPCLAEGRLYVGEGFHQDTACKLYCLDAATGTKLWEFETGSHTESSPCVVDGRVYFGAGDDGVYCLDARTGDKVWHFSGLHVDTSPTVAGNRLYGGSGYGNYEVFCLDLDSGQPHWRIAVDLPVFAAPVVSGDQVFFGIGNGDFVKSADRPAGALLCVDAVSGRRLWRHDVADAVHARPVVEAGRVYFCSRDQHVCCVERSEGRLQWRRDLGSPVLASPSLVNERLYVAASGGQVCCLEAADGQVRWAFDVSEYVQMRAQVFSSPAVTVDVVTNDGRHQIYFGAGVDNLIRSSAMVFCLVE